MPSPFVFLSKLYGVASPSKWNCTDGKEESIFVSEISSSSIFLLIIYSRELNLFRREFMLSCAKISLLMFLWHIFSKALHGSGRIWWNFMRFFKNWIVPYRFMARVLGGKIWLTYPMMNGSYAHILNYLFLKSWTLFASYSNITTIIRAISILLQ